MNKLVLLALLGLVCIAWAGQPEEERSNSLENADSSDLTAQRVARDAHPDKKQKNKSEEKEKKKKRKRTKKNKVKGNNGKRRSGKKDNDEKKKKKRGKSGKKDKKKRGKSAKKDKKEKKRKGGKSKKNNNNEGRQSCTTDAECLTLALKYLKNNKDKVTNYLKQKKRVERFLKVTSNKLGKKTNFTGIKTQLTEAGGGNASSVKCQGSSSSSGATKLKELVKKFSECEKNINSSCGAPPAYDAAAAEKCATSMNNFAKAVKGCETKTGAEACTCWKDPQLATLLTEITACDLKPILDPMVTFKTACTGAFAGCRGSNSDAADVIYACSSSQSTSALLAKLKTLKANKAAMSTLKTNAQKLATRRASSTRSRSVRAATCADFTSTVSSVASSASSSPSSSSISTKASSASSDLPTSCTATEKTALSAAITLLEAAISVIEALETAIQDSLLTLTGSTASSSAIDSATTTTTTTSASATTKSSRRHAAVNKFIF